MLPNDARDGRLTHSMDSQLACAVSGICEEWSPDSAAWWASSFDYYEKSSADFKPRNQQKKPVSRSAEIATAALSTALQPVRRAACPLFRLHRVA